MNIFIDESGSFVNSTENGSWNTVVAYLSPECDRRRLQGILTKLKRSVGKYPKDEIKLKHLDELQYFRFLKEINNLNGALFSVATDAGINDINYIAEHQRIQAEKIVKYKDKMLHESARDGLQELSNKIRSLPAQLYVQLFCQINLIAAIIERGILYFVQRQLKSLGNFRWRIDQKNSDRSQYEKAFETMIPGILQTISLSKPMITLNGADYSAFSKFDFPANSKPMYLKEAYGISINESESATNIGLLMTENLEFVDSKNNIGVQIADLLASGLRRTLRMGFSDNYEASKFLGGLMIENLEEKQSLQLLSISNSNNRLEEYMHQLIDNFEKYSKPMLC